MRIGVLALGCVAVALAMPAVGHAATVELVFTGSESGYHAGTTDSYELRYTALPGEVNRLDLDLGAGPVTFRDTGAPLLAGAFCTGGGDSVVCSAPTKPGRSATISSASADLGDGGDSATVAGNVMVHGGAGDDTIVSRRGLLTVDGGPGADLMRSDDAIAYSTATYAGRTAPVSVTPDGVANDGEAGEGDDVVGSGFRTIEGGEADDTLVAPTTGGLLDGRGGDDRLIGGASHDVLVGGEGNDTLEGGGGNDEFAAEPGGDLIRGGDGVDTMSYSFQSQPVLVSLDDRPGDGRPGENDDVGSDIERVTGGDGPNVLVGSDGPDQLFGGTADDRISGGGGDDLLAGNGGDDQIDGGAGRDSLALSGGRAETRDGETDSIRCLGPVVLDVDRRDAVGGCFAHLTVGGRRRLRATKRWTVDSIAASCDRGATPSKGPCRASVKIRYRDVTLGSTRVTVGQGKARSDILVALNRTGRTLLRRGRTLTVVVSATTLRLAPSPNKVSTEVALLRPPLPRRGGGTT